MHKKSRKHLKRTLVKKEKYGVKEPAILILDTNEVNELLA